MFEVADLGVVFVEDAALGEDRFAHRLPPLGVRAEFHREVDVRLAGIDAQLRQSPFSRRGRG